jgi:hypothetical protein
VNGRLLSIAEETVTEFVAKATGTAIDWIQLPGMKVCVFASSVSSEENLDVDFWYKGVW